jgi:RNA polymerase-binding transcription factor DksA
METSVRSDAQDRIARDLGAARSRLQQLGGAVAVMELPGTRGASSPFADEVDQIQATASRDVGLATRDLLVERVHRLSAALERLHEGEYGVCVECAEPIAPARLHAVPEVQTCIRCQAGLERLSRRSGGRGRDVPAVGDDEMAGEPIHSAYRSLLVSQEEDRYGAR